jgi:hypothetical protein
MPRTIFSALVLFLLPQMAGAQSTQGTPKTIIIKKAPPTAAPAEKSGADKSKPASAQKSTGTEKSGQYRAAFPTDAPEISRSVGEPGGVLLFWPRVNPKSARSEKQPLAWMLQHRLKAVVERALPGRKIDVRPEPERVCSRTGCAALTVGVLLHTQGDACVAVALVAGPGQSATHMIPWGGDTSLKKSMVEFRQPPESQVRVHDYAKCEAMLADPKFKEREEAIIKGIRQLAGVK